MKTSANGRKLIEQFEGLQLQSYNDGTGTWTIGYGHTTAAGPPQVGGPGMTITRAQADTILSQDLGKVEAEVGRLVKVPLNQNQFDALVSFEFNTGGLGQSSVLRDVNAGNFTRVPHDLSLWIHAGGKVLPGLVKRRSAEGQLFMTPVSAPVVDQGPKVVPPVSQPKPAAPTAPTPAPVKEKPMGSPSGTLDNIEQALEAAGSFLPTILGTVGVFYPPAKSLLAFLPLLQVALQGVETIRQATGGTAAAAQAAAISHLTPGAPNAPALSAQAQGASGGTPLA